MIKYIKNCFTIFLLGSLVAVSLVNNAKATTSDQDIKKIVQEVYNYSFPLVATKKTLETINNVSKVSDLKGPMGQFFHTRKFVDASYKDVVSINNDTLYTGAALDLSKDSYVIIVPKMDNRYYVLEFLDGWTNVFKSIGTRTGVINGGKFVFVSLNYKGKLPKELIKVQSPTDIVGIIGRIQTKHNEKDIAFVNNLQDKFKIIPLSAYIKSGENYTPPKNVPVDSSIDMKVSPMEAIARMNGEEYYSLFAKLLKNNPPYNYDKEMIKKMAKLGITPGKDFDVTKVDPKALKIMNEEAKANFDNLSNPSNIKDSINSNGWKAILNTGDYKKNYNSRAYVAKVAIFMNLTLDALYPQAYVDENGKELNGKNNYVLHFDKKDLPKVKGFWSITLYDKEQHLYDNPLNRYVIGTNTDIKYNKDGSLDIYIQHKNPGKDKEVNWLPAPAGSFNLMLRMYWLDKSYIGNKLYIPGVKKIN